MNNWAARFFQRKHLKNLKLAAIVLFLGGFGLYAWQSYSWDSFEFLLTKPQNKVEFAASAGLMVLFYLFSGISWICIAEIMASRPAPIIPMIGAHLGSQGFKYLPSSFFSFSSKTVFTKTATDLPFKSIALAILVEVGAMVGTSFSFFAFIELLKRGHSVLVATTGLVLVVGLSCLFLQKWRGARASALWLVAWIFYFFSWSSAAAAYFYFSSSFGEVIDLTDSALAQSLSYGLSLLAVFSPGGIGVRELIFTEKYGFSEHLVINWRIFTTGVDLVLCAAGLSILYGARFIVHPVAGLKALRTRFAREKVLDEEA